MFSLDFQRFSSFLVGCGVGFGLTFYYVYQELDESNVVLQRHLSSLEKRLAALEAK